MESQSLSSAIFELYARTMATGKVTCGHRKVLMEAICSMGLEEEERSAIDRILWATVQGRLAIAND